MTIRIISLTIAALLIVAGCTTAESADATTGPTTTFANPTTIAPTTIVTVPATTVAERDAVGQGLGESTPADDATVVVGSGVCDMTSVSEEAVDGVDVILEHFVCENEMSDPRVSGTEDMMVVSRVADYSTGGTWTAQDTTLTNDGGIWRGSAQGVVDLAGVHPFAEGVIPFNYGEAHYIGEGAYNGLEYHYYISGSNGTAGVTGWIQPTD